MIPSCKRVSPTGEHTILHISCQARQSTSFNQDKVAFNKLGLLDTVGYVDFQNSKQLADEIISMSPVFPLHSANPEINYDAPIYVLKGALDTEGEVLLMSALKKSHLRFRTYDTVETPRLSLYELRKQVSNSLTLITHLLAPQRTSADIDNAKCAIAAGIAMASEKAVLMIQEGEVNHPVDYRDVVVNYSVPANISKILEPTIHQTFQMLQSTRKKAIRPTEGLLQKLDIGDVAAENEIRPLNSYFVKTGQYHEAKRGHARLVVGRKGSGKTAIFYAVRNSLGRNHAHLILDLKPEGYQFTKLREAVLYNLSPGLQEHTLTAFWNAILLAELAHKISKEDFSWVQRDPERKELFDNVIDLYHKCGFAEEGDFSERLLNQVNRLKEQCEEIGKEITSGQITEILYSGDIRNLNDAIGNYLEDKDQVWLLIDNLDKGWPTCGATTEDILILRTVLEATRKIQRQLESRDVDFNCLVFLRNDIYEHLIAETTDKGKDTAINLDWSDPELFKEMFRLRVIASELPEGEFDEVWEQVFEPYVDVNDSFAYVVERTLMRPRDFLTFIHTAIEVAINRGHDLVTASDLKHAELRYSDDLLKTTAFELKDIYPGVSDFLYVFLACNEFLTKTNIDALLQEAGLDKDQIENALNLLIWFGFIGVKTNHDEQERYAYEMRYDLKKLLSPIERDKGVFVIHPAFRSALECEINS